MYPWVDLQPSTVINDYYLRTGESIEKQGRKQSSPCRRYSFTTPADEVFQRVVSGSASSAFSSRLVHAVRPRAPNLHTKCRRMIIPITGNGHGPLQ